MKFKYSILTILSIVSNIFLSTNLNAQKRIVEGKAFNQPPRPPLPKAQTCPQGKFRTYDGTCNNTSNPSKNEWGATDIALFRELPPEYGVTDRNNAMGGENRITARAISNLVSNEPIEQFNAYGLSTYIYIWGQFIDHDITLTPTGTTESVPVKLPADEPLFTTSIPFKRSEVLAGTGTGPNNPRQQMNLNTAFIDGSMVYGSDSTRAKWLRTLVDGKLKTSSGNLLPYNTVNLEYSGAIDKNAPSMTGDNSGTTKTFVAGDVRAAEHPGLTAMHTVFLREHNRICDRLKSEGVKGDEEIYQRARKEVGALIQAITYQEFLPTFGLNLKPYNRYDPNVRPDILNTFATASYRFGHSVVADDIFMKDNNCNDVGDGAIGLLEVFFNAATVRTYGVDPILRGLAAHTEYELDLKVNSTLRNMLFGDVNSATTFGLDLVSLNIQRGRDHGLPSYNHARQFYTGSIANSFKDITIVDSTQKRLQLLYKNNVNDVDLWVGLLAEDHIPGKSFGKTLYAMLKAQFENLRDGDFYYYLNDPFLDPKVRDGFKNTTFADVIKRNSGATNFQTNVFSVKECPASLIAVNALQVQSTEKKDNSFAVFPNPVQETLIITTGKNLGTDTRLDLLSTEGKVLKTISTVKENETFMVPVTELTPGVYFMSLTTNNITHTKKFIKE